MVGQDESWPTSKFSFPYLRHLFWHVAQLARISIDCAAAISILANSATTEVAARFDRSPANRPISFHGSRITNFHVDPTCSPTRSALMSGRYSTRTGVWHTIMGRSMMDTNEVTIAEVLNAKGYRTGMFGKWHLSDNYPCRPQDQGFDETFYNGGGGVTQTPDFFGNDYFDDTYFRNGTPEKAEGYCTDVWFREALKFIKKNKDQPFFVYVPTNAPHGPFLAAEKYSKPYEDQGIPKTMAAFYGMITNIDENMGLLMGKLKEWDLEENTILIFMTDNGTAAGVARSRRKGKIDTSGWRGFNAGMRGQKGSEYDGGHRVPFIVRWPAVARAGVTVDDPVISMDLLPTIAAGANVELPRGVEIDGCNLRPLLTGKGSLERDTLYWHFPHYRHNPGPYSIIREGNWKLIKWYEGQTLLFNLKDDLGETKDLAQEMPAKVRDLDAKLMAHLQQTTKRIPIANPDWKGTR